MTPPNATIEETGSGRFRFARDAGKRVIPIPASRNLEGYLVYDAEKRDYAQVRLLKAQDLTARWAHQTAWKDLKTQDNYSIFPEMLDLGLSRETPYYISKLPAGEPIDRYLKRNGPLPWQAAVPIVLGFVESLAMHGLRFYRRFAFSPESLWLESNGAGTRLILGEVSPIPRHDAEAINTALCLDLLQWLSGHPWRNQYFQNLCREIKQGPQNLDAVETALKSYLSRHLPVHFRPGCKPPLPILEQRLASPLVVSPNSSNLNHRHLHQDSGSPDFHFTSGTQYGF